MGSEMWTDRKQRGLSCSPACHMIQALSDLHSHASCIDPWPEPPDRTRDGVDTLSCVPCQDESSAASDPEAEDADGSPPECTGSPDQVCAVVLL